MTLVEEVIEQDPGLLRVTFPEAGGGYELTCSPDFAQAVGDCCGVDFYFRAKYGKWEFETEDKQGHAFPEGDPHHFICRGSYDRRKPGGMRMQWVARILRQCLAEWWGSPAGKK
jgi:hypothetical protein